MRTRSTLPGAQFVYFTGELSRTRQRVAMNLEQRPPELDDAADAWEMHKAGAVALTQRRVGPHRFEYLATRTKGRLAAA